MLSIVVLSTILLIRALEMSSRVENSTIWILWFQGFEQCPEIVKQCVKTWQRHNPDWQLQLLDEINISEFVTQEDVPPGLDLDSLSYAHKADIIRLILLKKFGGVWADATTYCTQPLNSWLNDFAKSDFFAFSDPGPDRKISNWFLYSKQEGAMINMLLKDVFAYWNDIKRTRFRFHTIEKIINRQPRLWFGSFLSRFLKKMPYFWFHYLFGVRLENDTGFASQWKKNIKYHADNPHKAQMFGLGNEVINLDSALNGERGRCPIYKLTWKIDDSQFSKNALWWHFIRGDI